MRFDFSPYLDDYIDSFERLRDSSFGSKGSSKLPSREDMKKIESEALALLFPSAEEVASEGMLKAALSRHMEALSDILFASSVLALEAEGMDGGEAKKIVGAVLSALPDMRRTLKKDAAAGFLGDPAARSEMEVILSYPGFRAIAMHRLGHLLFRLGLPLVPRMLNELVHGETGIDIHPGAEIGEDFFIDHGTGVVIGETAKIGKGVKIYQGVTLGALSFQKDASGLLLRGQRRHPEIGDNVTIYANATVLGPISIGEGSVIGSNAWIKDDVPPFSKVVPEGTGSQISPR